MRERIREEDFSYTIYIYPAISVVSTAGFLYLLYKKIFGHKDVVVLEPVRKVAREPPEEAPKTSKFESLG